MNDSFLDLKIVRTGQLYQGVSAGAIRQWVAEGRVQADDLVRPPGASRWMHVAVAPELAPASLAANPPVAQSPVTAAASPANVGIGLAGDDLGIVAPARARRRRLLVLPEDTELDMTPMIDVTFQLLIFFMLANQLANPAPIEVPLASYGKGVSPDGKQSILLDAEGRYYLGERADPADAVPSLDALVAEVEKNAADLGQPMEVIINAHKNSHYQHIRELLERLHDLTELGPIHLGVEEQQR
jgi:biopolymer transport protein ExbD